MKQFWAIFIKEFKHVLRDSKTMLMLFGLPIIQILLFGFALNNEVKNASLLIINHSSDPFATQLVEKFRARPNFVLKKHTRDHTILESEFQKGLIQLALIIPDNFSPISTPEESVDVQLIVDASNPNTATALVQFATSIIQDLQSEASPESNLRSDFRVETSMIYNPDLSSARTFVPGLIALILLLICVLMTSVSLVREKEKGNMEVLLISPVRPLTIIMAKVVPYLLLSLINLAVVLFLSVFVLSIPIAGSLWLLSVESILLILTSLCLGLLISALAQSQETAMMIALMGMLLPTLLFTGFMFPLENMPLPLQYISYLLPSRWYYSAANDIMIKGLGISDVWRETLILTGMCVALFFLSIRSFKSRLT